MCEVISDSTYGYPLNAWEQAKKEAIRAILTESSKGPVSYSDLAKRIRRINFDPHDYAFPHPLGQISVEEDAAGRGMLTVLVVRQEDGMPGSGFFDLAQRMGRDVRDKERCWSDEAKLVLSHSPNHPLAA
jgi:hypothetical protein